MSREYDGKYLKDDPHGGREILRDMPLGEGDLLVSEGPEGNPLWKKKKKLNEDGKEEKMLNE